MQHRLGVRSNHVTLTSAVDLVTVFTHKLCGTAMNITLSADPQTVEKARLAAQRMGKSLNQAVRDYLEQLAGSTDRDQDWADFASRCMASGGQLQGWRFDRDQAHER